MDVLRDYSVVCPLLFEFKLYERGDLYTHIYTSIGRDTHVHMRTCPYTRGPTTGPMPGLILTW